MAKSQIDVTEEAKIDLFHYTAFERKTIIKAIRARLTQQSAIETKNRKKLRDNPIANWELRSGKYRIFYEIDQRGRKVTVVAVGHKEHNILFIRGEEMKI